ncbi:hypothetical protein V1517DRAFT_333174 [Lipomyces orientalis]|uniref:Uncharacterized protein n=1 Tax=Lipomyces orientalis TaxID=1233043 RepID=A0ACC3TDQ4_9ASCO
MVQSVDFTASGHLSISTKVIVGRMDRNDGFDFPMVKGRQGDTYSAPLSSIDPNRTITNSQLVQHAVSYAKSSRRVSDNSTSRSSAIFSSRVGIHRYSAGNMADVTQNVILPSPMSPGSLRRFERGTREQQLQLPASPISVSPTTTRRRKSDPRPPTDAFLKLKVIGTDASSGNSTFEDSDSEDNVSSETHLVNNALRLRARVENQQLLRQGSGRGHGRRGKSASSMESLGMPPGCEIEELENSIEDAEVQFRNRYSELLSNPGRANMLVYFLISALNFVIWGIFHVLPSMKYHCCLEKVAPADGFPASNPGRAVVAPGFILTMRHSNKISMMHKISFEHLTSNVIITILWARHIALVSYVTVVMVKRGPLLSNGKKYWQS